MTTNNDIYTVVIDGVKYTGTQADISCKYCKNNAIRLYIEPDERGDYVLFAEFTKEQNNIRTYIANFEDMPNTINNGLRLFFTEFLCNDYDDYVVKEKGLTQALADDEIFQALKNDEEYQKHLKRAEERITTLLSEFGYNVSKR